MSDEPTEAGEGQHGDPPPTVPPFITDTDRLILSWVVSQVWAGRAPTRRELLNQFEIPEAALSRPIHLRLLAHRGDRIFPTRNGMRILGEEACEELVHVSTVLESAKRIWRTTHDAAVPIARLVDVTDLDVSAVQRAVMLSPLTWSSISESGLPSSIQLYDGVLSYPGERYSTCEWEFTPPQTEIELIGRFHSGERVFPYTEVRRGIAHHGGQNLSGLVVKGGLLCAVSLQRSRLDGAVFENLSLEGSAFHECSLRGVTFCATRVVQTHLVGCDLEDIVVAPHHLVDAVVDRSFFSTKTDGLRERVLAETYWNTVRVDGQWVDRSWLTQAEPTQADTRDEVAGEVESNQSGADEHIHVPGTVQSDAENEQVAAARGDDPCPRLRFLTKPKAVVYEVIFDGQSVAELERKLVGARLIEFVVSRPDIKHHVLDLQSAVDGLADLYEGTDNIDGLRETVRELHLDVTIPGTIGHEQTLRTGALLRRLQVVRDEVSQGHERAKGWTAEDELAAILHVLRSANYSPIREGNDPVNRAQKRLEAAYSRARGKLTSQHREVGIHLNSALKYKEFWIYEG